MNEGATASKSRSDMLMTKLSSIRWVDVFVYFFGLFRHSSKTYSRGEYMRGVDASALSVWRIVYLNHKTK